jgi:prolyl-tRNA synthetase
MKITQLFSQTLRDNPTEAEVASHQLLLRAGFIRQLAAGVFTLLPLGQRVLMRLMTILREEINAIGGQEILMPIVNPAEIWIHSGRYHEIDAELSRFRDRNYREMVLAMTHEEVVADLIRKEIHSYRQLPKLVYHIQTKWRDDPRPRAGLIRAREFIMKDSYSLDLDSTGLNEQYKAHSQAYMNVFHRCGLEVIAVAGDVGMMGGYEAHEFMYLTPIGEDTLILCDSCGYAANRQVAKFYKPAPAGEVLLPLHQVATPGAKTILALAEFLKVPPSKTAKAVFLIAEIKNGNGEIVNRFVFAIVRGDMEVNETKLAKALEARSLRPATEDEIRAVGAEPGYASPVNLKLNSQETGFICIVDELIPDCKNLVAGANETGYHYTNVNFGRDFQADIIADITAAQDGDLCPNCGAGMNAVRGVEVGNIFKLGTRFSDAMGCKYLDKDGNEKPVVMGSYGIGLGRLMGCIAEAHHDENGLMWPVMVAPFQVHLVALSGKQSRESEKLASQAEEIYQNLTASGLEVLFDDRDESPGVKFKDADLIGLPIRLTISERSLQNGGVEFKKRAQSERIIVGFDELVPFMKAESLS